MPFSLVKFFVRLLNVIVFGLCIYSFTNANAADRAPAQAGGANPKAQAVVTYGPASPAGANPAASSASPLSIKSFVEWKNERLKFAQLRIEAINGKIGLKKADLRRLGAQGKDRYLDSLYEQLKIEEENLDFATDLSVTDYLVSYLLRQKNRAAAIQEAARKLSPEDVAKLIEAYAQKTFNGGSSVLPPTAESLSNLPF